jgi:DNA-directed RNA polymerase subunit E'/Rpb7
MKKFELTEYTDKTLKNNEWIIKKIQIGDQIRLAIVEEKRDDLLREKIIEILIKEFTKEGKK